MTSFDLALGAIFVVAIVAGLIGALAGLGGGVLVVPVLTIGFGLPIRLAIGVSIVSVIATSSAAAAAYVRDHLTNTRVGIVLEIATTTAAIAGALLAAVLHPRLLFVIFGVVLLLSVVPGLMKLHEDLPSGVTSDRIATRLDLASSYPDQVLGRSVAYQVTGFPLGFGLMAVAGLASGLLGIGSGALKVLALDTVMQLPMKVATATSNFMIGVTAAASAGIYFWRGDVPALVAAPVALGVLIGATVGARILPRLPNRTVRLIFLPVLVVLGLQMVLRGLGVFP